MCYVIQREDAQYFQPSVIDATYREAFYQAKKNGVETALYNLYGMNMAKPT